MTRCMSLIKDRPAMTAQVLLYQAQCDSNKVGGEGGTTESAGEDPGASIVGSGRDADLGSISPFTSATSLSSVFRFLMTK